MRGKNDGGRKGRASALQWLAFASASAALCAALAATDAAGGEASWTDPFGETTYRIEAPDTAYAGQAFDVVLGVWDPFYPDDAVAAPWQFLIDGVEEDGGFWLYLSDSSWVSVYTLTYVEPDTHAFVFTAQDLGHGMGGHDWQWFEIEVTARIVPASDAADPASGASRAFLLGSAPNPFRTGTVARFELAEPEAASLRVYDIGGRLVSVLVERSLQAGRHEVFWNGRDAAGDAVEPGVYFLRLESAGLAQTRRVVRIE